MPKEILTMRLERAHPGQPWGFVVIGGKDQALTVKVGSVRPHSAAEQAGLRPWDYIWQINGKEVFDMSHGQCVDEIKRSGTVLTLAAERGDHIVPNFEEIWPSKKKKEGDEKKAKQKDLNLDYYYDAMENGPGLSGHLPIAPNFTTVGKPNIYVNQYDSPLDVYSDETIEEMKSERLTRRNPDYQERVNKRKKANDNGLDLDLDPKAKFDASKSSVIGLIGRQEGKKSRGE